MSMIGRWNFELQEQAEELGFETVQEALDNGYTAKADFYGDGPRLIKVIDPQEQAHEAWLQDREHILRVIHRLRLDLVHMGEPKKYDYALFEIEAFIRRGEE